MRTPSVQLLISLLGIATTLSLAPRAVDAAQAQTGTVRVDVAAAGVPVAGATVSAAGASTTTDVSGVATLTLPAGAVAIAASKDGAGTATARIDVVAGRERALHMALVPAGATIVSTPRTNRAIDDQAVPIDIIGRARIESSMLRAPGDITTLFDTQPGVRVQTTSPVLDSKVVRIQGLPGRYTRLLFDGVHLFSDRPGGYALLRIPAMDLDRVEIVQGPAGAFYGSDSPAGAINLIPRRAGTTPSREVLFNQSSRGATDGAVWFSTPPAGANRTWSSTFLASAHRQEEQDVNDDGWSDAPKYTRGILRPVLSWDNHKGRKITGLADVTFEKREGGSVSVREKLETRTADGYMSGEMTLANGSVLAGAGALFIQSRTRDFTDARERDRLQTATIEITLSRQMPRHKWLGGIVSDWYGIRSADNLPWQYISTRPGMFFQDDFNAARWLVLSGSLRLDHHNMYGVIASPRGSALIHRGHWSARVSGSQGYFTPRILTEETEAAGLARLKIAGPLEKETARGVSADVSYGSSAGAVTFRVFRTKIDDPGRVDRATYTFATEADPFVTRGLEIFGTARCAPFSVTGAYTFERTRERGDLELPLTPKHSAAFIAALDTARGRIAFETTYTGEQRLERNPYRSRSEAYTLVNVQGELRFGRARAFINADNLSNVRQTDWDPIARPARDVDGRWTVDAWAPLLGRTINGGLRIAF